MLQPRAKLANQVLRAHLAALLLPHEVALKLGRQVVLVLEGRRTVQTHYGRGGRAPRSDLIHKFLADLTHCSQSSQHNSGRWGTRWSRTRGAGHSARLRTSLIARMTSPTLLFCRNCIFTHDLGRLCTGLAWQLCKRSPLPLGRC